MNMRISGFARSTLTITFLMAVAGAINSVVCITQAPTAAAAHQEKNSVSPANPKLAALIQRQKSSEQAAFDEFVQMAHKGCSVGSSGLGKMVLGFVGSYVGVAPEEVEYAAPFFAPEHEQMRAQAIKKVARDKESAQHLARLIESYAQQSDQSLDGLRAILHQENCLTMGLDPARTTLGELVAQLKKQQDALDESYFDNVAQALYLTYLQMTDGKLKDIIAKTVKK